MRTSTAAVMAATVLSCGVAAGAATAAGGPPPPPKAANGAHVEQVAAGLHTPTSFAFGGGSVFEGDGGSQEAPMAPGGVYVLKGAQATKLAGSPGFVAGVAWSKGTLYVSGGTPTGPNSATWQILAWSGWNGTAFTKQKAIYTAPKKFAGFNGLTMGPDGRLYIGVDVGLIPSNDHGPAKTPYVYDILTLKPNGTGLKVYATGIRQPWQLTFARGARAPFVSDLGQDSGAKNPPDFVLKVKQGDNYGFPQCNWIAATKCKGFTKPFQRFAPHTDIMGLAIIGRRLYMSSFLGAHGKGPGGAVYSMPLAGGPLKPVLSGFVAPVVGLGAHAGWLYAGSLTGQVFRVKP
jgi:glucose/arabinose dehydrogenase